MKTTMSLAEARRLDRKRYLWALGAFLPLVIFLSAQTIGTTSEWGLWAGVIIAHVILPLLDVIFGTDNTNLPEEATRALEQDRYYRLLTYINVILQYAILANAMWFISTNELSTFGWLGMTLSIGLLGGLAINTGHELGHKHTKIERFFAKLALAQTFYTHFFVEHNRGHHMRVATPEDPASSRLGENFYSFLFRTIIGSLMSSVELEKARLKRNGKSFWSVDNELLQGWVITAAVWGTLLSVFGWDMWPFVVIQGIYGASLLEAVNYLEHYGLLRRKQEDGRYERCQPHHSWNSNHIVSNLLLFHLQRHSDHHAWPARRYQSLRHFEEAPQLPAGYGAMIVLAYLPPLWRMVMDKRVIAHYKGDLSLANIHPSARHRYLK